MSSRKKVLVPLDGSHFAEYALPVAAAIASRRDHDLELIAVYEDEPTVGGWSLSTDRAAASLKEYLQTVARKRATNVPITTNVVGGRVAEVLVKEAGRWNVDLVVMSTHGRGAIDRAWLGSVADEVVRHATVPVVLVRPLEDEPPPSRFTNVVVALDGSKRAERCLDWATRIGGTDATYTLLRVVPGALFSPSTYLPNAIKEEAQKLSAGHADAAKYLEGVAGRAREAGYTAEPHIVEGVPAAAGILAYAEQHPTDLIVITTHGRSGFKRLLLGSVADKVVRGAGVPVLVTRAE